MGRSSLLGLEHAATETEGRDTATLGPGDNSDSGSDRVGLEDVNVDDPVERHRARRGVGLRGTGVAEEDEPEDEEGGGRGLGDEGDNIPQGLATPRRMPPGPNPEPDGPENPGLPGDGDSDEMPAGDEPDAEDHR